MSDELVATKLSIPRLPSRIVSRPRLTRLLDDGLDAKLTLISAPAGSGKTTLVGEWCASKEPGLHVAWLSLDEDDNDPIRFLKYLSAALGTLDSGAGETARAMLQSPQPPPFKAVVTSLINAFASKTDGDDDRVVPNYSKTVDKWASPNYTFDKPAE